LLLQYHTLLYPPMYLYFSHILLSDVLNTNRKVLPSTDYKVRHDIKICGAGDHNTDTAGADILDMVADTDNKDKDAVPCNLHV